MMDYQPLVSVLMTAYNREKYIAEAIESVLASSYSNFELIIVDDCSKDDTVNIAKSYEKKDKRIKVYVNETNLGDYRNRNRAASFAKGKYLKYLDSDDTIYPWGISSMVYCMELFPDAAFGLIAQNFNLNKPFPFILLPEESYYNFFFKGKLIGVGPTGSIIKKEVFDSIGGFTGSQYIGDTELWYKLASEWPLVCLPPGLIWWREHDGQQIRIESKDNTVQYLRYKLNIAALQNKQCPLSKEDAAMALRNVKNLFSRNIINHILHIRLKKAIQLQQLSKMSILDLLLSLKRNRYPKKL
jgi:glycosyltransferase involved in cell wall biosynthesis